jgi:hypothetical protein
MPFFIAYLEMTCIGDYADFVVYGDDCNRSLPSASSWMVPGSEQGRDEFGRKTAITGYPQEA